MNEQTLKPTKRRHGERGPGKRRPPIKMWNMTGRMERGAALVAADELTDVEIAEKIGVHRTTLEKWKTVPAFVQRCLELRRQMRDQILREGIASRVERIKALMDRWMRMRQIIADREKEFAGIPVARTGLMIREYKSVGNQIRDIFILDAGLLKELRDHEKQAAQELGQWTEHVSITDLQTARKELAELIGVPEDQLPLPEPNVGSEPTMH